MSSVHDPARSPDGAHPAPGAPAPSTSPSDVGVADLLGRLSDQFTTLLRQEVELAKAEAKQELTTAAKAGAGFGAAAVTGHFALLFLSFAAAWGLAALMPVGLAFLIVGVVYAIVAAIAAMQGKKQADDLEPNLDKTTDSLTATAEWAKEKTS